MKACLALLHLVLLYYVQTFSHIRALLFCVACRWNQVAMSSGRRDQKRGSVAGPPSWSGWLPGWNRRGLVHSVDKMLCVLPTPCSMYLSVLCIAVSVLNWSLVTRTVCATHTSGSAVRGNGSIVTISLRNKLSAIHWGNYVSKHTGQSQCYTEQSLRLVWND